MAQIPQDPWFPLLLGVKRGLRKQGKKFVIQLKCLDETVALAQKLAFNAKCGDIIGLTGELGIGKTEFARAFICARLGSTEVPSPTFTLVQIYEDKTPIWHFDLYRIAKATEIFELGIEDAFDNGISIIEWPEKMLDYCPREWLRLKLVSGKSEHSREATLEAIGDRAVELAKRSLMLSD